MESEFIEICRIEDLKEKVGKQFFVEDLEIAVFKVDGQIYALSNICPHQKIHLIHEGLVEDGKVYCPVHGWQFDLRNGNLANGRRGLDIYEVKVIDGNVYIRANKKQYNW
ncbi:MAG: nitrite reductase small subunit NirD [Melioribacter sp.]|nr:nitrite reductase small subunit NirD [Melioribacter sp.]